MYADDTSLSYQSLDINELNEVINNDLEKLQKWLIGNKLPFNAMKTQSTLISTMQKHTILRNQDLKLSLKIGIMNEKSLMQQCILVCKLTILLDWKYRVCVISSKVSKAVGFLKHAKSILPLET